MLSDAHAKASEAQNEQFRQEDAWDEPVRLFLEKRQKEKRLPVTLREVHEALDLPTTHQNNDSARRINSIAEALGWEKARRRVKGKDGKEEQKQGLWPCAHRAHLCTPAVHTEEPAQELGSEPLCTPCTPLSRKEVESGEAEAGLGSAEQLNGKCFAPPVCTGCTEPQTDCSASDPADTAGVHSGVHRGPSGVHRALKPGDSVELQAEDGTWSGRYRLATVEETNIGTRARIEAGSDFRVVALEKLRPAAPAPDAEAA